MNSRAEAAHRDGLIDLGIVAEILWRAKIWIVVITGIFAVSAIVVALLLPNEYKATVIVVPTESNDMSSLGGLAGQFGGLASLAGISLGGESGSDKSAMAMELVKTWDFLDSFIRDNSIEVAVFAATGWDRATDRLVIDADLYDIDADRWVRDFDPDEGETAEPSSWELYEEMRDRVSVRQKANNGFITLSVEFYSPILAKEWVDKLVAAINLHIRTRDRDQASKSIRYLRQQIEQTSLAEMKNVFYQLIEEQTKSLMLAEVSEEYALSVLSPARVPEEKSWPNRVLIVIGGTVLGLVVALLVVLLRSALGNRARQADEAVDI